MTPQEFRDFEPIPDGQYKTALIDIQQRMRLAIFTQAQLLAYIALVNLALDAKKDINGFDFSESSIKAKKVISEKSNVSEAL